MMRYFVILFFLLTLSGFSQEKTIHLIEGTITANETKLPVANVHIINTNLVKGTITDRNGEFKIKAAINDTLHISCLGFKSLSLRVTNDWLLFKNAQIQLTESAYALEEVIVTPYNLTGYLQVDSKLIPERQDFRYTISGLPYGYEAGEYNPKTFSKIMNSIFNPTDFLYNTFGKKGKELRKLKKVREDETIRELLETKFDRETLATLLNVEKEEIAEILKHCNYSETFIQTANDLQIMDAINGCYEEYKILKR